MSEQKLWIAVLVQGLTDALGSFLWMSRLNTKYEQEAKDWLTSKDFKFICSLAGMQPNQVKDIYDRMTKHKHYLTLEDIRHLLNETFNRRSVL